MSFKIVEDQREEVEVREIEYNGYFEFYGEVYQRFGVDANFTINVKPKIEDFPIFAVNLTTVKICFFSSDGKAMVTRLYEKSPLVLTRRCG